MTIKTNMYRTMRTQYNKDRNYIALTAAIKHEERSNHLNAR